MSPERKQAARVYVGQTEDGLYRLLYEDGKPTLVGLFNSQYAAETYAKQTRWMYLIPTPKEEAA